MDKLNWNQNSPKVFSVCDCYVQCFGYSMQLLYNSNYSIY